MDGGSQATRFHENGAKICLVSISWAPDGSEPFSEVALDYAIQGSYSGGLIVILDLDPSLVSLNRLSWSIGQRNWPASGREVAGPGFTKAIIKITPLLGPNCNLLDFVVLDRIDHYTKSKKHRICCKLYRTWLYGVPTKQPTVTFSKFV